MPTWQELDEELHRRNIQRINDIGQMVVELKAAGWRTWKGHSTVWESPKGYLFYGPAGAWKRMKLLGNLL